jgi:hypothetical protein
LLARKLGVYAAPILVATALVPPSAAIAGPAAGARTCSTWVQMTSRNPSTGDNLLTGVTAVSPGNVWAVGQYFVGVNTKTLIEHWNGQSWKVVKSPNAGDVNSLNGVYAASGSNIWAVGSDASGSSSAQTLMEHWNGKSWKVVKSPDVGALTNALIAVRGTSARDIWAVGYTVAGYPKTRTLVLHYNGTSWKVIKSANGDTQSNQLTAMRPLSPADAWAAGITDSGGNFRTLIEHCR